MRDGGNSERPRVWTAVVLLAAGLALGACDGPPGGPDGGPDDGPSCPVPAPTQCPEPMPHYADVSPIFQQRCVVCHNGAAGGPWSLEGYGHVVDWQDTIRANLLDCTMPPPDAGIPITRAERTAILSWLRCGYPL